MRCSSPESPFLATGSKHLGYGALLNGPTHLKKLISELRLTFREIIFNIRFKVVASLYHINIGILVFRCKLIAGLIRATSAVSSSACHQCLPTRSATYMGAGRCLRHCIVAVILE